MPREMVLETVRYGVIEDADEIERYVLATCDEEWDPDDFVEFGQDLYDHCWELRQVPVSEIQTLKHQLESPAFIADVTPRIEQQRKLHRDGEVIPPLILRGHDYLIFDGYARWHLFHEIGAKECLAYVSSGRRITN